MKRAWYYILPPAVIVAYASIATLQKGQHSLQQSKSEPVVQQGMITQQRQQITLNKNEQSSERIAVNENNTNQTSKIKALLPSSWEGTRIDGRLQIDEAGHLVVEQETKDLFDYFLSATGEVPTEELIIKLQHYLTENLPSPAREEGLSLLSDYISYRVELSNYQEQYANIHLNGNVEPTQVNFQNNVGQLQAHFEHLYQLRRDKLGMEAADAFFGLEEEYDQYQLQKIKIAQNESLSSTEKQAEYTRILDEIPTQVRFIVAPEQVMNQLSNIDQQYVSETERYQARSELLGNEAAQRLAVLDKKRKQWKSRLSTFRTMKAEIEHAGLSTSDQQLAINQLLNQQFSSDERKRVAAIENISTPY
ncbi:lipase secretion chaperone [Zooshikella sp. RANM57]|uniref:lipase secretion chaperone n=1 Tax=Zooshikella sp. RANM57 TaxID=3425863 RepID=UPI003D6DB577